MLPKNRPGDRQSACLRQTLDGRYGRPIDGHLHHQRGHDRLFPARSTDGHLIEYWENRKVLPKWGNDLRQSYRTLAQAAGLSEIDIHLLMNHSLPGVNAGYITRERLLNNHLRKQQERISMIVLSSIEKAAPEVREELRAWLCKSNLTFDE